MILYHGSIEIVENPEIRMPSRSLDYGYGFYTTTSLKQAEDWVKRKLDSETLSGFVNVYELDESSIKQFNSMNLDKVYSKMFNHIFDPILSRFRVPEKERAYTIKFYLTGVFAIVMEWLDRKCCDDMDTIIKIIIDCVLGERNIDG